MQGVEEVLGKLKKRGYRLGLLSNGVEKSRLATIEVLGIGHYFEVILASEALGISKPDHRVFSHAARLLSLPVQACCYVGDSFVNDYQGAIASGMQAYWLQGFDNLPSNQPLPDNTTEQLTDLLAHF